MANIMHLIPTIPGVTDVLLKEKSKGTNWYKFNYRGVKFDASVDQFGNYISMCLHYKAKLFSNGKALDAFSEWGLCLVPKGAKAKNFFFANHYADIHSFAFPLYDVPTETLRTVLNGFLAELPGIMEQFAKDGKIELDYA